MQEAAAITVPQPERSYQLSLWEDLDDVVPTSEQPKLCRVQDPDCEACQ